MKTQKDYWDQKIKDWTVSSYSNKFKSFDLVERLANLFRGPIRERMEVALEKVGPAAKGKVIIDMGCGLGDFCFKVLKYQPKEVIGVDVSKTAVKEAEKIAGRKGVSDRIRFIQADIGQVKKLPSFDLAVGLGFIDYLDQKELKNLFDLLSGRQYLFSFFEKKTSLINLIHNFYVKWQKCPGAHKYSRQEMLRIASKEARLRFWEKDGLLFITNLPGKD